MLNYTKFIKKVKSYVFIFFSKNITSQQNRDFDRDREKPKSDNRQKKQNNVILSSINISPFSNMIGTQK